MELVRPALRYKDSYLAAMDEELDPDAAVADGSDEQLMHGDFEAYVEDLLGRAQGHNLPEGYVPDSILWLVDEGAYIGRVSIRHELNEHLTNIGGHIGYRIRPSMRGRGYGTEILRRALPEAKNLGLSNVLLTCDETNTPSKKIIEKNRGVFEDKRPNPNGGPDKLRYWIRLS